MSIQEQLFEGADSERNYLSRVTQAVAMYCIFPEQCTLSDAADRAQERQMSPVAGTVHVHAPTVARSSDNSGLYRCVISAEPSHVICSVTCNKLC